MSPRSVQKAASEVSVAEEPSPSGGSGGGEKWMLVVPLGALPRDNSGTRDHTVAVV